MLWHDIKEAIGAIGLSEDGLHIYVGLLLYVLLLKLMRRPPSDPLPLAILTFAALLNEGQDIKNWMEWGETVKLLNSLGDVVNTVLIPTVATLWCRRSRGAAATAAPDTASGA